MGEAQIFLFPCETNILHPVIRIEVTDSGIKYILVNHENNDSRSLHYGPHSITASA